MASEVREVRTWMPLGRLCSGQHLSMAVPKVYVNAGLGACCFHVEGYNFIVWGGMTCRVEPKLVRRLSRG